MSSLTDALGRLSERRSAHHTGHMRCARCQSHFTPGTIDGACRECGQRSYDRATHSRRRADSPRESHIPRRRTRHRILQEDQ